MLPGLVPCVRSLIYRRNSLLLVFQFPVLRLGNFLFGMAEFRGPARLELRQPEPNYVKFPVDSR